MEFPVNVTYMVYQMLVCSKNSSAYFYSDSDDDNSLEYVPL